MNPTTSDPPAARPVLWAVAGNPNSGKSTLFNALTGLQQHVANFAGVTVERREGLLRGSTAPVALIDLPGVYSLSVRTPDERIPRDVLFGLMQDAPLPHAILIVIDASNLERNLYLATQLLELGLPAALVCNMSDRARAAGAEVDAGALSRELGVPVFETVGHVQRGVRELRDALAERAFHAAPPRRWRLPDALERAVNELASGLARDGVVEPRAAEAAALAWLAECGGASGEAAGGGAAAPPGRARPLIEQARRELAAAGCGDPSALLVEARYGWINGVAERVVRRSPDFGRRVRRSDRIDGVLTHGAWGPAIFAAVMLAMFWSIFSWAEPLMRAIETGQRWLAGLVQRHVPAGPLCDLLADGVIGGAGAVVTFFPQICILFLSIAVLEDSGYMARAAYVSHRFMSRAGLPGKSFIPLVSSFACAIPGIMATRVIEHRRDRLATILIAPLMSCSARLPVYLTVIAAVFGGRPMLQTGVIAAMYLLSLAAGLGAAAALKRTLLRGAAAPFIIELPPYQLPRPAAVLRTMWERARLFLTGAGTTIVALCVVLWALAYFPRDADGARDAARRRTAVLAAAGVDPARLQTAPAGADMPELPPEVADALRDIERDQAARQLRQSLLGRAGQIIEPVVRPLGFDWKIGIGVLASFAAREVFVGTMGTLYSVGDSDGDAPLLRERMRADVWRDGPLAGRPVFSIASGLSLMVFYVLCCQCVGTLAVVKRETNSWRWPAFMFAYMTVLAYAASLATYQIGSRLGG